MHGGGERLNRCYAQLPALLTHTSAHAQVVNCICVMHCLLYLLTRAHMQVVNAGVRLLENNSMNSIESGATMFRITFDSGVLLLPFMAKQTLYVGRADFEAALQLGMPKPKPAAGAAASAGVAAGASSSAPAGTASAAAEVADESTMAVVATTADATDTGTATATAAAASAASTTVDGSAAAASAPEQSAAFSQHFRDEVEHCIAQGCFLVALHPGLSSPSVSAHAISPLTGGADAAAVAAPALSAPSAQVEGAVGGASFRPPQLSTVFDVSPCGRFMTPKARVQRTDEGDIPPCLRVHYSPPPPPRSLAQRVQDIIASATSTSAQRVQTIGSSTGAATTTSSSSSSVSASHSSSAVAGGSSDISSSSATRNDGDILTYTPVMRSWTGHDPLSRMVIPMWKVSVLTTIVCACTNYYRVCARARMRSAGTIFLVCPRSISPWPCSFHPMF